MSIFSDIGDAVGNFFGGGDTVVNTTQIAKQGVKVDVSPNIGVHVDTTPIGQSIDRIGQVITTNDRQQTELLKQGQKGIAQASNAVEQSSLISSQLLQESVEGTDLKAKVEVAKLRVFGEAFNEGKRIFLILGLGFLAVMVMKK